MCSSFFLTLQIASSNVKLSEITQRVILKSLKGFENRKSETVMRHKLFLIIGQSFGCCTSQILLRKARTWEEKILEVLVAALAEVELAQKLDWCKHHFELSNHSFGFELPKVDSYRMLDQSSFDWLTRCQLMQLMFDLVVKWIFRLLALSTI